MRRLIVPQDAVHEKTSVRGRVAEPGPRNRKDPKYTFYNFLVSGRACFAASKAFGSRGSTRVVVIPNRGRVWVKRLTLPP